eukprot:Lankesteria_metandrocarpae@DN9456_c0_g1_i1.p1
METDINSLNNEQHETVGGRACGSLVTIDTDEDRNTLNGETVLNDHTANSNANKHYSRCSSGGIGAVAAKMCVKTAANGNDTAAVVVCGAVASWDGNQDSSVSGQDDSFDDALEDAEDYEECTARPQEDVQPHRGRSSGALLWMECCESDAATSTTTTSSTCMGGVEQQRISDCAFDNQTLNPMRSADGEEMLLACMSASLNLDLNADSPDESCSDFKWTNRQIARCCLRTRKYNDIRAVQLFRDFTEWRRDANRREAQCANLTPVWIFDELFPDAAVDCVMKSRDFVVALDAGIFQVLGCADHKKRPVIHVRMSKYIPGSHTQLGLLQALAYNVEKLLRCSGELGNSAQLRGICILFDCQAAAFTNFDLFLPRVIFQTLCKKTPLRVGAILLLNMNSFFAAAVKTVSVFLNEKLKQRLIFIGPEDSLTSYLPQDSIPVEYGGRCAPCNIMVESG